MRKIYHFILKTTNLLLAGLLGFMGFSTSCEGNTDEYGAPYAKYSVKGKVTNTEGKPISGIRVRTINKASLDLPYLQNYSSLTDKNGDYDISIEYMNTDSPQVLAEDIDGIENGLYQSDSTFINIRGIPLTGGKGWFMGKGSTTVDFTLKEDTTTENEEL